jgi:hypothetical protein
MCSKEMMNMYCRAATNPVPRVAVLAAIAAIGASLAAQAAHAGSIVINAADPNSSLQYKDDSGRTKDLVVTWSEVQTIAKVKAYLVASYGQSGRDMPYMIDRSSQSVSVLVDRASGRYETVSFGQLRDF